MGCTEIFLAQAPSIIIAFLEPSYVKNTRVSEGERERVCVCSHTPSSSWQLVGSVATRTEAQQQTLSFPAPFRAHCSALQSC